MSDQSLEFLGDLGVLCPEANTKLECQSVCQLQWMFRSAGLLRIMVGAGGFEPQTTIVSILKPVAQLESTAPH